MSVLTQAIHARLSEDAVLVTLLATYHGLPAIFTFRTVPGDARPPYIVTGGEVSQQPADTKNSRGRAIIRDVRMYTRATGETVVIEQIAERVRTLLHRAPLSIEGFEWVLSNVSGPIAVDEPDVYGRVISLALVATEE